MDARKKSAWQDVGRVGLPVDTPSQARTERTTLGPVTGIQHHDRLALQELARVTATQPRSLDLQEPQTCSTRARLLDNPVLRLTRWTHRNAIWSLRRPDDGSPSASDHTSGTARGLLQRGTAFDFCKIAPRAQLHWSEYMALRSREGTSFSAIARASAPRLRTTKRGAGVEFACLALSLLPNRRTAGRKQKRSAFPSASIPTTHLRDAPESVVKSKL
jgi:hypothetical protein